MERFGRISTANRLEERKGGRLSSCQHVSLCFRCYGMWKKTFPTNPGVKCCGRTWFNAHTPHSSLMEEEILQQNPTWCGGKVSPGPRQSKQTLARPPPMGREPHAKDMHVLPSSRGGPHYAEAPGPCQPRVTHEDTPTLSNCV